MFHVEKCCLGSLIFFLNRAECGTEYFNIQNLLDVEGVSNINLRKSFEKCSFLFYIVPGFWLDINDFTENETTSISSFYSKAAAAVPTLSLAEIY